MMLPFYSTFCIHLIHHCDLYYKNRQHCRIVSNFIHDVGIAKVYYGSKIFHILWTWQRIYPQTPSISLGHTNIASHDCIQLFLFLTCMMATNVYLKWKHGCCPVGSYLNYVNPLWSDDAIGWQGARSTLSQVMACCLTEPSHYLKLCPFVIHKSPWQLYGGILTSATPALKLKISKISSKHTYNKLYSNLPGANE